MVGFWCNNIIDFGGCDFILLKIFINGVIEYLIYYGLLSLLIIAHIIYF